MYKARAFEPSLRVLPEEIARAKMKLLETARNIDSESEGNGKESSIVKSNYKTPTSSTNMSLLVYWLVHPPVISWCAGERGSIPRQRARHFFLSFSHLKALAILKHLFVA
jgi:hypothetical protein